MNKIFCGNALDILKTLPPKSVDMCVTSPPYYGLRDYGVEAQIGNEQTPYEYIQNLLLVFEEVKRVLKPDGTLWVNIADSYSGSGKGGWNKQISERNRNRLNPQYNPSCFNMPKLWHGIKQKDMIGVPWLLAFSLRENGWYLRSDIIWHKKNCMPESVKDLPAKCYEHIFLLSKSPQYYYDYEAVKEPAADSSIARYKRGVSDKTKYRDKKQGIFMPRDKTDFSDMRNKRDVWSVAITQNLIGGILDGVQNGLGYQPAWCKANNAVFAAVLANETGGYGYADLAAIARNAILQCRDMYLRPEYYAEKENAVRALISDLINAVEIGTTDYKTAEKQAYTRIYQMAEPTFNPDTDCVGDFCYWDIPPIDSALLTQAKKLLKNARSRAEQITAIQ